MDCPEIIWHVPPHLGDGVIVQNDEVVEIIPGLNLVPQKATFGSMAYDFISPFSVIVPAHGKVVIDTLVAVTLSPGYAIMLGSRSGLAAKQHLTVEAGWIDNDYRGKIGVVLYNHGALDYIIEQGERIAQGMIVPIVEPNKVSVKYSYPNSSETERGEGGFGSTGRKTVRRT